MEPYLQRHPYTFEVQERVMPGLTKRDPYYLHLFIRACFIHGLQDDRIKTMVKAKGNVNTPMAQIVEVALEEESAIKSQRFKRNSSEKGQYGNQGNRYWPQKHFERWEVRVFTVTSYRCKRTGHTARYCKEIPDSQRASSLRGDRVRRARVTVVTRRETNKGLAIRATGGRRAPKMLQKRK